MKYLKQFGIILFISFIGEILNHLIPLPVPASIYGIVILFLCLELKVIKLDDVKDTGKFLIEIMPVMFIPAAAGVIDVWSIIKPSCFEYVAILIISTIAVMAVSGLMTQFVVRLTGKSSLTSDNKHKQTNNTQTSNNGGKKHG